MKKQLKTSKNMKRKKRVLVWLSWGVDSAVAAYILQNQGYEVIAGFMKNYSEPNNPHCQTKQDRDSAISVAQYLNIKTFIIFDFRKEYEERIIKYIYKTYQQWITPNPDILCNSLIKFDLFLEKWLELNCNYIATGHYAKIKRTDKGTYLYRWIDKKKDQSYFLSQLSEKQLEKSLFPLGNYTKEKVRQIANNIGLPNANRPDSQWLCFIGNVPIKSFLEKKIKKNTWNVINTKWERIGKHDWARFYTIGQRHWFETNKKCYITNINIKGNSITVTENKEDPLLLTKKIVVKKRHWIGKELQLPYKIRIKIRYGQGETEEATMYHEQKTKTRTEKRIFLTEKELRAVAPWQFLVAYDKKKVIGSGVIAKTLTTES